MSVCVVLPQPHHCQRHQECLPDAPALVRLPRRQQSWRSGACQPWCCAPPLPAPLRAAPLAIMRLLLLAVLHTPPRACRSRAAWVILDGACLRVSCCKRCHTEERSDESEDSVSTQVHSDQLTNSVVVWSCLPLRLSVVCAIATVCLLWLDCYLPLREKPHSLELCTEDALTRYVCVIRHMQCLRDAARSVMPSQAISHHISDVACAGDRKQLTCRLAAGRKGSLVLQNTPPIHHCLCCVCILPGKHVPSHSSFCAQGCTCVHRFQPLGRWSQV